MTPLLLLTPLRYNPRNSVPNNIQQTHQHALTNLPQTPNKNLIKSPMKSTIKKTNTQFTTCINTSCNFRYKILVDPLITLSQQGGVDYALHITTGTPGFADLHSTLNFSLYKNLLNV